MSENAEEPHAFARFILFPRAERRIRIKLSQILFPARICMMVKIRAFRQSTRRVRHMNLLMNEARNIASLLREQMEPVIRKPSAMANLHAAKMIEPRVPISKRLVLLNGFRHFFAQRPGHTLVGVDAIHPTALRLLDGECLLLPEIPVQRMGNHARSHPPRNRGCIVSAVVVDDDDLSRIQMLLHRCDAVADILLLVARKNQHRKVKAHVTPPVPALSKVLPCSPRRYRPSQRPRWPRDSLSTHPVQAEGLPPMPRRMPR